MSDNQGGINMPQAFQQQMNSRFGGSGPWWQNVQQGMQPAINQQIARSQAMPQFQAGAPMRAGQPMGFNPALLQSKYTGPQIPQVPLPQRQPMGSAFGGIGAPQSTAQFVQNWQAQQATLPFTKSHTMRPSTTTMLPGSDAGA